MESVPGYFWATPWGLQTFCPPPQVVEPAARPTYSTRTLKLTPWERLRPPPPPLQERIHHRHVLAHPANRQEQGVDQHEVHALIERIVGQGFSRAKTTGATCIEVDPGSMVEYEFNKRIVHTSDGMLPPVGERHVIRACAVAGCHTTFTLRAISAGCTTGLKSDLQTDGRLSAEKVWFRLTSDPHF